MTPEGRVKSYIKKLLDRYKPDLYYYMPVPGGYGKTTLDYLGCFHSLGFAIEAKAPDKEPTERQQGDMEDMAKSGMAVFVISDEPSLEAFAKWLKRVEELT